jgi:hypothetical protein
MMRQTRVAKTKESIMDLAKIGEVKRILIASVRDDPDEINVLLKQGWVLLSIKILDYNRTVYLLGKPREKQKPEGPTLGEVFGGR